MVSRRQRPCLRAQAVLQPGLVEEGAHQGGLGDVGDDPVCQLLVGPGGGEVPAKAGAVVADHLEDPPADVVEEAFRRIRP